MNLAEVNVLLVTLDSCPYGAALAATTPNLDRLGRLYCAEAAGNYTLPAHIALFNGNLPTAPGRLLGRYGLPPARPRGGTSRGHASPVM